MTVLVNNPIIDAVLDRYAPQLGDSATDYRNHLYRALNYQLRLLNTPEPPPEIALAWAVHDIGIWTAGTWDYLAPSAAVVDEWAAQSGVTDVARTKTMVVDHHKLRSVDDRYVETFRLADRVDAFRGLTLGTPLTRADVREVVAALPYGGFHTFLIRSAAAWTRHHPLRPLPMLRW